MSFSTKDIYEFHHFESVTALVDYADQDIENGKSSVKEVSANDYFHPCRTYDEASKLVREGWPEGVRTIDEAFAIASDGMDIFEANHPEMEVVGPICVSGAFCAGDPECMMVPAEPDMQPVINIVFDISINCNITPKQMQNRGAAILALAARLEQAGKRVGIYASSCANMRPAGKKGDDPIIVFLACVKEPVHDFNMHTLAYTLANADFFRRHGFRIYERSEETPRSYGSGYAMSLQDIKGIDAAIGDIDLYFEGCDNVNHRLNSVEDATKYVLEVAEKAGVIET